MATKTVETAVETPDLEALRAHLEAARTVYETAQARLDELISEQADLPSRKRQALAHGDGGQFALLQQRVESIPAELYFASVQKVRAQAAIQDAERAVLQAELAPLLAEYGRLSEALSEAQKAVNAVGHQVETRRGRMRMIADQRRRLDDKLAELQSDFEKQSRLAAAPVMRALNFAH